MLPVSHSHNENLFEIAIRIVARAHLQIFFCDVAWQSREGRAGSLKPFDCCSDRENFVTHAKRFGTRGRILEILAT